MSTPLRPFIDFKVETRKHLQAAYDYLLGLIQGGGPHTHEIADVTGLQPALDGKEPAGTAAAAVAAHEAAGDPHPQYLTAAEGDIAYEPLGAVATHAAAGDPHPAYQRESEKGAAGGYAGLDGSSKLAGAQQKYGSAANTAAEGNDVRLSDARAPLAHATTHKSGGSDPIKLDELAAPTDVTTLNASASAHGLMQKFPGGTANFLRADGAFAAPTVAAHATSHKSGGSDPIKLDELAAPTDVTTLNADTTKHGLMQKDPGGTTNFLRADGTFAAPPGGGSTPTGTGFRHVTSGVEDAAAKLVDTADINDDQVTFAKLQNVASGGRILGRSSLGAGDVEDLSATAATALLDVFTSSAKGLAPASGGGTANFLRADGTFAAPPGGGGDPAYAPGSFTVQTETGKIMTKRLQLTGTQRATLQGTARLRIT
jgi:hypothetical protein